MCNAGANQTGPLLFIDPGTSSSTSAPYLRSSFVPFEAYAGGRRSLSCLIADWFLSAVSRFHARGCNDITAARYHVLLLRGRSRSLHDGCKVSGTVITVKR